MILFDSALLCAVLPKYKKKLFNFFELEKKMLRLSADDHGDIKVRVCIII
jgi:hypothetical protein